MLGYKTKHVMCFGLFISFLSPFFLFWCKTQTFPSNSNSIEIERARLNAKSRADYIASGCTNPQDNFPGNILTGDLARYELTAEQWNNIMRVINKYEQDDPSCNGWTTKYTYCANIDDGRGITLGIYGATTGGPSDTEPDAPDLFANVASIAHMAPTANNGLIVLGLNAYAIAEPNGHGHEYINVTNPQAFCMKISSGLSVEQITIYESAQWITFDEVYITPVFQVLSGLGEGISTTALFGAFIDTALNEGEDEFNNVLNQMDCSQFTCHTALGYAAQFSLARKIDVDNPDYEFNQPKNGCLRTSTWYNFSALAPTLSGATANAVFIDHVLPINLWGPYDDPPIIGTSCSYNTPGE